MHALKYSSNLAISHTTDISSELNINLENITFTHLHFYITSDSFPLYWVLFSFTFGSYYIIAKGTGNLTLNIIICCYTYIPVTNFPSFPGIMQEQRA